MITSKYITRIVAAIIAIAAVLCLCAMGFSDSLTELAGGPGVTMQYESKLFDTDEIIEINIEIEEEEWQDLLDNAISETYHRCNIEINGTKLYSVGIRPKGNTSLTSIAADPTTDRYSLKLEFDQYVEGQTCFGLDKLILNNNYADATNMKEAIVYDMYQYLGVDASLYNYAKVSVNGEYWGIYLALEAVEDSFLMRNYGSQNGQLYKPESMGMGDKADNENGGGMQPFGGGAPGGQTAPPAMPEGASSGKSGAASETESTSSGASDGDSEMPEGDSGVPGGDSEMPEGDSEIPDGDSGMLDGDSGMPDRSSGMRDGDFTMSSGNSGMPGGDFAMSSGDSGMPGGDFAMSSGDSGMPGGDLEMPNGNFEMPDGGFQMPNGGSGMPDGNFEMPDDGFQMSSGDSGMSSGDSGMPGGDFAMPGGEFEMPDGNFEIPGGDFQMPGGFSMSGGANLNYTDDNLESYETIWEGEVTKTKDKDHKKVVKALKQISEGTELETYLDIDNVLKYMAVHTFVVNQDSLTGNMAHNYYLYESDGQLNILPWDYNLAFGGMGMGGSGGSDVVNHPIDTPFSGTKFFDTLLQDETYLAQYHAYLQQLVEDYVSGGRFDETYQRIQKQISSLVETDPTAFYSFEEYEKGADMLYDTVSLRAESIKGQLEGTVPATSAGQRENASALIDESSIDVGVMGTMNMGGMGGGPFGFGRESETADNKRLAETGPATADKTVAQEKPATQEGTAAQEKPATQEGTATQEKPVIQEETAGSETVSAPETEETVTEKETASEHETTAVSEKSGRERPEGFNPPGFGTGVSDSASGTAQTETLILYAVCLVIMLGGILFAAFYRRK